MEAFVGFDSILHVYSFNLSIFYKPDISSSSGLN